MPLARQGRAEAVSRRATLALATSTMIVAALPAGGAQRSEPIAPTAAERIVSLVPAASALLVALGAGERVVGRASDDRTPELGDVDVVGTLLRPSLEKIVALEPDLVVVWAEAEHGRLAAVLGSRVVLPIRLERLAHVPAAARTLGARSGRAAEGARLARRIETRLRALTRRVPTCSHVRALWAVGLSPPVAAGPGTLPDDLLGVVGVANALEEGPVPWVRVPAEQLLASDVDVLIWPVGGDLPPIQRVAERSPWRLLDALQEGRILEIEADLVHEAGPDVVHAAELLSRRLESYCPGHQEPYRSLQRQRIP